MNIRTKDGKIDFKKLFIQSGLYLVLFLMLVLIIAKEPSFLSIRNFKNLNEASTARSARHSSQLRCWKSAQYGCPVAQRFAFQCAGHRPDG